MNNAGLIESVDDIEVLMGVLNLLPNPVYVKDRNHLWVAVNTAFCKFLGREESELIGKSDFDHNPKEQAEVFWAMDDEVFETRQENINIEKTVNRSGKTLCVESRKSYYETSNGEPYIIGVLSDITELEEQKEIIKRAELKARQASISKSEFLANMSHEIRTPMNGIMGMSELLLTSELNARQTDFANTINRSGEALLTIINDILDFSKAEAGKIELDVHPFHLRNCIEDVTALLASTITETGLDLLLRIQPGLPPMFMGDAGRIRQILTNIIGNAVKFTHSGHVYIDVRGDIVDDLAKLEIQVIDTGIGIDADKLEHVFEKFNQVDGSTTRKYGGTGLGLSISKHLADLMSGDISVKSTLGEGTTFSISLPLPIAEAVETKKKRPKLNIAGSNVLIIDDNPINRSILKEQLSHWRCKSVGVESSQLGLALLQKAFDKKVKIDLIILDYQMPDQNGEDFYRAKQKREEFADIPVIMLSSIDSCELRNRMTSLNISEFMTKPARSSHLYDSIANAIHGSTVLPEKIETVQHAREPSPSSRPSDEHIDVLIAEDNEVNQLYVSYVMEDLGLSYKIVPNGKIAVETWQELSPKVILMDISMPEMNGYEATGIIRNIEKDQNLAPTPIIAVTAHSMKGDEKTCLDNGMDDYLSKPLALKRLKRCLENWGVLMNNPSSRKQA